MSNAENCKMLGLGMQHESEKLQHQANISSQQQIFTALAAAAASAQNSNNGLLSDVGQSANARMLLIIYPMFHVY